MWEEFLTEDDKTAIEREKQRAQDTIARLNKEKLDILAKLRHPMSSSESERLGLRVAEIDRALPTIAPDTAYWITRIKQQAMARKLDNGLKAKEQAKAAQEEADRQAAVKEQIGEAFVANGGTWIEFEQKWPEIRQQAATNAAVAAAPKVISTATGSAVRDAAREALAQRYGRPNAA